MIGERVTSPWSGAGPLPATAVYTCGYCDAGVTSSLGLQAGPGQVVTVCPKCGQPTYHCGLLQIPGVLPGEPAQIGDEKFSDLYGQIRAAIGAGAYAAAAALCREIIAGTAEMTTAPGAVALLEKVRLRLAISPAARGRRRRRPGRSA